MLKWRTFDYAWLTLADGQNNIYAEIYHNRDNYDPIYNYGVANIYRDPNTNYFSYRIAYDDITEAMDDINSIAEELWNDRVE